MMLTLIEARASTRVLSMVGLSSHSSKRGLTTAIAACPIVFSMKNIRQSISDEMRRDPGKAGFIYICFDLFSSFTYIIFF